MIILRNGPVKLEVEENNPLYGTLKKFAGDTFTVQLGEQKPELHKVRADKEDDFLELLEARKSEGQEVTITPAKPEKTEKVAYKAKKYYNTFYEVFGDPEEDKGSAVHTILSSHLDYYVPQHLETAYEDMSLDKSTEDLAVLRIQGNGTTSYVSIPKGLIVHDEGS